MVTCCQQAICVICLLNGTLLSNAKMISLWVVGIVPDFSDFLLTRKPQFLSCGADRNRNYLNYMGTKIFVSHCFTFCHFRINVVIVPIYIYLPNLEKSKGNLSKRKAFLLAYPIPLWLLPGVCLLSHLCFRRICLSTLSSILPLPSAPASSG